MLTLFRLIDTSDGTITISGIDISTIGVDALRRQLAVIPQVCSVYPWDSFDRARRGS